ELPALERLALEDDEIAAAEFLLEAEPLPPGARPGAHLQGVAGGPEIGGEGRHAVTAADVLGTFDEGGDVQRWSSLTRVRNAARRAAVKRALPIPLGHGPADLALCLRRLLVLALVVRLLAARHRQLHLGPAFLEVHA